MSFTVAVSPFSAPRAFGELCLIARKNDSCHCQSHEQEALLHFVNLPPLRGWRALTRSRDRRVTQSGFVCRVIYLVAAALLSLSSLFWGWGDTTVLWVGERMSGWLDRQKRLSFLRFS